jgi:hypothetical protein
MTSGLFSHWLGSLVHPANENQAPFSTDLLFPIYTPVSQLASYSACHVLTCWFLLKLFLWPWRWRRYVPPNRRLQLNRLHGVTSQKMILFKMRIDVMSSCRGLLATGHPRHSPWSTDRDNWALRFPQKSLPLPGHFFFCLMEHGTHPPQENLLSLTLMCPLASASSAYWW